MGSTGIGVDLATPIGNNVFLRAGFDAMPRFNQDLDFEVQVGENKAESSSKFRKLSGMLENMIGSEVDDKVTMIGKPTYYNFKLLVNVYPFRDKHWYLTGGFFVGPSTIAKAKNDMADMPSLMAVSVYNIMYEKALGWQPLVDVGDRSFPTEPEMQDWLHDKFQAYGRMGVRIGDYAHDIFDAEGNMLHKAGDPYMMEPDANSTVSAVVKVNSFKPYLGFGYGGSLLKSTDRYGVFVDCGAMFWGGTPQVYSHDGVNLTEDITNIRGKVGDYVTLIKGVKVFPVLNVRFACRLF